MCHVISIPFFGSGRVALMRSANKVLFFTSFTLPRPLSCFSYLTPIPPHGRTGCYRALTMSTDPLARKDPPAAATATPIATFRKRSPDHLDPPIGDEKLPAAASIGSTSASELKRRRLSVDTPPLSASPPVSVGVPRSTHSASTPGIPLGPLLFHQAVSAHRASRAHLQQTFIPSSVRCERHASYPLITLATGKGATPKPFEHDHGAASRALGLLLLSLHLLRIGLDSKELSYAERVAFALEFATVGFKVLNTLREAKAMPLAKAPELPPVDVTRLVADMQDAIGSSVGHMLSDAGARLIPPAVDCSKKSQPQTQVADIGNLERSLGFVSGGPDTSGTWLMVAENGQFSKTHGPPRFERHVEASRPSGSPADRIQR